MNTIPQNNNNNINPHANNPFDSMSYNNNSNNMNGGAMVPMNANAGAYNNYNQYQHPFAGQQQPPPPMQVQQQQPQMHVTHNMAMMQQQHQHSMAMMAQPSTAIVPQQQQQQQPQKPSSSFDPFAETPPAPPAQPYANYQVPAAAPAYPQQQVMSSPAATTPAPADDDVFGIFGTPGENSVVGKEINVSSRNLSPEATSPSSAGIVEEDETSVLSMVSAPYNPGQQQPNHQQQNYHSGSASVRSVSSTVTKPSCLDDPNFAPPPAKTNAIKNALILAHTTSVSSPLPNFDKISHSGYILSRISFRTILMKKWKQVFWIMYGPHTLYFFRTNQDFNDWVSNPYLTLEQRDFLVKLKVDFMGDLLKSNVRGYQVTRARRKSYRGKLMSQFKLERWMDYGPTIAAAFASNDEQEAVMLRKVMMEIMKRSHQDNDMQSQRQYDDESVRSSAMSTRSGAHSIASHHRATAVSDSQLPLYDDTRTIQTEPAANPYNYNASTGEFDVYSQTTMSPGHADHLNPGFRTRRTVGRAR